ncbi:two-component system C4-dicarboxylate transport response regulator DctD [Palleronia aestuarii]|uniref:Nif-specific regulatory protein n=1 Tax=Palleronia aestuarii TaxID=568105 RepID=A0A2W7P343_9RHOB|nr:sigma-54 dependent transcriptional regulator [Palleronia aestuarii]PZX19846.1 two-component system C4-dicarboxylate transport response regulator DctD [Palleronia aestuarii]
MSGGQVFLVDDDEDVRISVVQTLEMRGFEATGFARAEAALERIGPDFAGIVVCDMRMPGMDGMAFLDAALGRDADLPILLITGHGEVALAVEALGRGAYDFIEKPFAQDRLIGAVERALDKRRMTLELRALRRGATDAGPLEGMVLGRTPEIEALRQKIRTIAASHLDVLIVGATGTGKERVARAIHALSDASHRPFVAINLAALPLDQVETELFGFVSNAFPGASRARIGRLEHGRGGTILLDEISSAPLSTQAKLLRVLEERAVTPIGASEAVPLDARFITSSRISLEEQAADGRFRDDLLYRLNPVTLHVPDLTERRSDIPYLFTAFVGEAAERLERDVPEISPDLLLRMSSRDWPGNLRELRNAAELFVLGLDGGARATGEVETLAARLDRVERDIIASTLAIHGGNLKATYERLGIGRKTLYEKLQKHGLRREDFAGPTE